MVTRATIDLRKALDHEVSVASEFLEDLAESPIEMELGVALFIYWKFQALSFGFPEKLMVVPQSALNRDVLSESACLVPQLVNGRERYDFGMFYPKLTLPVIIECDGHDFHERTKEQAKRDRSRDRRLQTRGHKVMRFTGSEIWSSPVKCAEEIMDTISTALIEKIP